LFFTDNRSLYIRIMKHVTLQIPDNKYARFLEIIQKIDFVKLDEMEVLEEHKNIVRNRLNDFKNGTSTLVSLEDVAKELKAKFGL